MSLIDQFLKLSKDIRPEERHAILRAVLLADRFEAMPEHRREAIVQAEARYYNRWQRLMHQYHDPYKIEEGRDKDRAAHPNYYR